MGYCYTKKDLGLKYWLAPEPQVVVLQAKQLINCRPAAYR